MMRFLKVILPACSGAAKGNVNVWNKAGFLTPSGKMDSGTEPGGGWPLRVGTKLLILSASIESTRGGVRPDTNRDVSMSAHAAFVDWCEGIFRVGVASQDDDYDQVTSRSVSRTGSLGSQFR